MNKHTVTLETAKKLKELGWESSEFYEWVNADSGLKEALGFEEEIKMVLLKKGSEVRHAVWEPIYPAPIASELLESIKESKSWNSLSLTQGGKKYHAEMWHAEPSLLRKNKVSDFQRLNADTPAEALALMWIYLKENKLI